MQNPKIPVKIKVYYQALLTTSLSITPIFEKRQTTIESFSPSATFLMNAKEFGFITLANEEIILYHNILHVEIDKTPNPVS